MKKSTPSHKQSLNHNFISNKNAKKSLFQNLLTHKYQIAIGLILFIALILRFYNYPNRWGIGDDDSRDIAIAREAIARHELPLIGSFSSAGPFVFGPIFYWVIMASYLLLPFLLTAPVIITGLASAATVLILMRCGYLIAGKRLSLIIGILTATSPQLVIRATVLGQHTYVGVTTALLFLAFILYWKKKKLKYAFFMGLSLGAALSFHYQSINLLIFFAAVLIIPRQKLTQRIQGLLLMALGFLIPSAPLLLWDSQQQFANVRNILDYLLIGQYRLYVPNSWKLFLFKFLPYYWSFVVSGYTPMALFLMLLCSLVTVIAIIKRKLPAVLFVLYSIFAILLLVNRYYKGERSEGYLLYLSPFVLIATSWTINQLLQVKQQRIYKILGNLAALFILCSILVGNFIQASQYERATNTKDLLNAAVRYLTQKYPGKKFKIYDYHNRSGNMSQSLSLFLKLADKTDPHGMPIGLVCNTQECPQQLPKIMQLGDATVVDMQKVKNKDQKKSGWVIVNQENMYDDLIGWSKKHQLTSTFSISKYILWKLKRK